MKKTLTAAIAAASLLTGCATAGGRSSAAMPDLSGHWRFEVPTGRNTTHGAMVLVAYGPEYRGTLTTNQGANVLPIRSLTLQGKAIRMTVKSPQGDVVFSGVLGQTADTFEGQVTYHTGVRFPMTGHRTKEARAL